jgi:DNA replication protein DnaC
MIKRLGDAIKEVITERPANGVCILSATCEHCGDAFETIQRNGYRGSDVCTQCAEDERRKEESCSRCGERMTRCVQPIVGTGRHTPPFLVCYRCDDADREEAERRRKVYDRWCSICPEDYREVDRARLPRPDLLQTVLAWEPDYQVGRVGLFLVGQSYQGKTRTIYQRCRKDLRDGWKVRVFRPTEFGNEVSAQSGENTIGRWARELVENWDVVLFDDFGKERFTERIEAELFGIIENRFAQRQRIYFTSNEDSKALCAKFIDAQRAAALINRIKERCTVITF